MKATRLTDDLENHQVLTGRDDPFYDDQIPRPFLREREEDEDVER